jgi:peroxiredoxin
LPSVNRLYEELKTKGLEVALISFREAAAHVERTARERGYTAPVLVDETGDLTGRVYGVWGPPTVYVVDRRGQLVGRAAGPRDWASPAARSLLQGLLDAPDR